MRLAEIEFDRPQHLEARRPPEADGRARDDVRLLVTASGEHRHLAFRNLPEVLERGDLLVVNRSATIPASLPARGGFGSFRVNLCTDYQNGVWLAEPRRSFADPGPLPLALGDGLTVGGRPATVLGTYPGLPRLVFLEFGLGGPPVIGPLAEPIRYGYLDGPYPIADFQTIFGDVPGSVEMPSAARPFSPRVLAALRDGGVGLASILLHTGVSSLEVETDPVEKIPMYPEPFEVGSDTVAAIERTRQRGHRVFAVGSTVVRALEASWTEGRLRSTRGFTRAFIHPGRGVHVVDGLLTGFHDPRTSHLAMLYSFLPAETVRSAYAEAVARGYLWHEFGDSHLIVRDRERAVAG